MILDCPEVPQSSASILTWLKRRAGSAADLVTDLSQSEASEEVTVVGFFKVKQKPRLSSLLYYVVHLPHSDSFYAFACEQELNHEYVQVFYATAVELPDVRFVVTQDDDVVAKYGHTHDVVLMLKKVLHAQHIQTHRFTKTILVVTLLYVKRGFSSLVSF